MGNGIEKYSGQRIGGPGGDDGIWKAFKRYVIRKFHIADQAAEARLAQEVLKAREQEVAIRKAEVEVKKSEIELQRMKDTILTAIDIEVEEIVERPELDAHIEPDYEPAEDEIDEALAEFFKIRKELKEKYGTEVYVAQTDGDIESVSEKEVLEDLLSASKDQSITLDSIEIEGPEGRRFIKLNRPPAPDSPL